MLSENDHEYKQYLKFGAYLPNGLVEVALYGALGNAERFRNLVVAHVFHLAHHKDLAALFGHALNNEMDILEQLLGSPDKPGG